MLVTQDGGRMILLTQQVKELTLLHRQLNIEKLLINLPMLLCVDILFCTNQNAILNYGVIFDCLINVTMT